jgi:hypothetical protein
MKALVGIAGALVLAGCATTGGTLSDAADRLDRSAGELYDEVRSGSSNSDLERSARQFADVADDFERDVSDRASREELRERFERVAKEYHDLRDDFGDERTDAEEREAFAEVTRAYLDLERSLQYSRVSGL